MISYFLIIGAAVTIPVLFVILAAGDEAISPLLILSGAVYGVFFYLDVKSTVWHGRKNVAKHELSPVFRVATRKLGIRGAIPVQMAVEVGMIIMLSYMITYDISARIIGAGLILLAVFHCMGWLANRREHSVDF